jgi:hypothetical protein
VSATQPIEKFEEWCIVEVMGHKRFAGFVTNQAIGGAGFVRVDVPAVEIPNQEALPAFTKFFAPSAIYCISPCTEETARAFAAELRTESFARYEAPRLPGPQGPTRQMTSTDFEDDRLEDDPDEAEF